MPIYELTTPDGRLKTRVEADGFFDVVRKIRELKAQDSDWASYRKVHPQMLDDDRWNLLLDDINSTLADLELLRETAVRVWPDVGFTGVGFPDENVVLEQARRYLDKLGEAIRSFESFGEREHRRCRWSLNHAVCTKRATKRVISRRPEDEALCGIYCPDHAEAAIADVPHVAAHLQAGVIRVVDIPALPIELPAMAVS